MAASAARLPVLAAALAAGAALPAAADAATWTEPPGACYVSAGKATAERQVVAVTAEGFAPGAAVSVLIDGVPADDDADGIPDTIAADASGRVGASLHAPHQPAGSRPFSITLAAQADPAASVTAVSRVTALAVTLRPAQAPPSSRVRFRGRGFVGPGAAWAHYVYRGVLRRTVRLADRPATVCGTFSVRRRQIPVTRPRVGRWTLQIDQQRAYSEQPESVFVRLNIDVRRVMR